MPVIDYEPHPTGGPGYIFKDDQGRSAHLFGPEADSLKSWIDMTRPADARTAAYDPAAPFGSVDALPPAPPPVVADVGPNMSAAPAMSVAPPQAVAPAVSVAPPAAVPPHPVAPPPPGIVQPVSTEGLPELPGSTAAGMPSRPQLLKEGLQQAIISSVTRPHYVGGHAAVDPHALAASAVPVPVTETVQGAIPETPEEQQARVEHAQMRDAQREEALSSYKAATAQLAAGYEEQRSAALSAQEQALADQRDALAKRKAVDDDYAVTNARLQKERDAAANDQVDPSRLFHGKNGTVAAIGSALAVGLGAFGSSLSRSPNYAQQIVTAAIDRDVEAQRDQIARKGAAAQNAITEFQKHYGLTVDEAAGVVKETQLRYAAASAQYQAAKLGSAEAQQKAAIVSLAMLGDADKEKALWSELYKGRKTTQYAMVQPQAATRGGLAGPNTKDLIAASDAVGRLEKAIPEGGGEGEGKIVPGLARAATAVDTGLRALPELMKLHKDAGVTGQVVDKIKGFGADTPLTVAAQHMAYSVASAEVNGMVPEKDRVHELEQAFSAKNPITRERNIMMGREILIKKKEAIESISAKTAKVGSISVDSGGGEGGRE